MLLSQGAGGCGSLSTGGSASWGAPGAFCGGGGASAGLRTRRDPRSPGWGSQLRAEPFGRNNSGTSSSAPSGDGRCPEHPSDEPRGSRGGGEGGGESLSPEPPSMVVLSSSELRHTGRRRRRRGGGLSLNSEALSAVELSRGGGRRARRGGGAHCGDHCGVLHSSGRRAEHSGPCRQRRELRPGDGDGDGHGEDGDDPRGSSLRPRGSVSRLHFFFFLPAASRFSFARPRVSRLRLSGFRFSFPADSRFSFPAGPRFSFPRARSRLAQPRPLPGPCRRRLSPGEKSGSSDGVETALEAERALEAALEAPEVELKRRLRSCGGEIQAWRGGSGRR